jgi:hypothetical protein
MDGMIDQERGDADACAVIWDAARNSSFVAETLTTKMS